MRTEESKFRVRTTIFLSIIFLLLLGMAPYGSAATITIDNTTAGGIGGAIDTAGSGGTVILNPGSYFTNTVKQITVPITIKANTSLGGNPSNTIIDGIRTTERLFYSTDDTFTVTLTLDNLTFQNFHYSNIGGVVYFWRGPIIIKSSRFVNCSATSGGTIFIDRPGGTVASVTSSTFSGCTATTSGGAIYVMSAPIMIVSSTFFDGSAPAGSAITSENAGTTIHFSRFFNNSGTVVYLSNAGTLDATNNWWGTNTNPSGSVGGVGTVDADPWLKLGFIANSLSITQSQTSVIQANLTYNSDSTNTTSSGYLPDGIPVVFNITSGTGSTLPTAGNITSGMNATTFTPSGGGTVRVNATIDDESLSVPITILGADFTGTPVSGTQQLFVTFSDGSGGSPTLWNWSFGDGSWFNTTVGGNPTHTYANTGTYTVNLTISSAAGTDTRSRARYIVVVPPDNRDFSSGDNDVDPTVIMSTITTEVNVGGNSAVSRVDVTGTGISGLVVTGMMQSGAGSGIPPAPGRVYEYINLIPARYTTIAGTVITFTVPVSWLDENHLTPQDMVMFHYTGTEWETLPTVIGPTTNGKVTLTAQSTGFSLFAISGLTGTAANATHLIESPIITVTGSKSGQPTRVVTMQETTVAPVTMSLPESSFPVLTFALVGAGLMILAGCGFMIRRWWIRRQNPALFRRYDE